MKYILLTLILGITQSIVSQKSKGYQNVFWDGAETLNCLYSDEPIAPNSKGEYHFFYSSNEDRRVYEKTLSRPDKFLFYKFKTKEYAQNWCDGIPFESKQNHNKSSQNTTKPAGDAKLKMIHYNPEISNFKRNNLGVTFYKDVLFTGYKKSTYPNGAILEISKYKDGLTDDLQMRYYKNGAVKSKAICLKGEVLAGKEFYENGKVAAVIELEGVTRRTKKTYYDKNRNIINQEFFEKLIVYKDYFEEKETFNFIDVAKKGETNKKTPSTKEIPSVTNATLSIDHYTLDGYELTKYIKLSDFPALKNKLTEFNSLFHKIEYDRGAGEFIFQEHNTPGYVLVTTERGSINGVIKIPHYYFNQKAIKIIHDYLSKYGYSYFTGKVLGDLPMNDKRIRKDCKKTYSREQTIKCPNCSYWTDKQKENVPCTRCKNKEKIKTGKIITSTCPSCNGKGFYYNSEENKEWGEIEEYYKNNQVIQPDLGFNGGLSYSKLKWKGLKSGTYFIYQTDLGLKYDRLGTGSLLDKNETVSKYDFVQIAFQRKVKP
ncbi:MAG: hypothetical protein QNL43_09475 [Crocinitomicaceae bacterium]|tara:strand:- start:6187 stop:7812 length:1626 start_codon:yes stop_codon:yes gene_type:complete